MRVEGKRGGEEIDGERNEKYELCGCGQGGVEVWSRRCRRVTNEMCGCGEEVWG